MQRITKLSEPITVFWEDDEHAEPGRIQASHVWFPVNNGIVFEVESVLTPVKFKAVSVSNESATT